MSAQPVANAGTPNIQRQSPAERIKNDYVLPAESESLPMGMFDAGMRASVDQQANSPTMRKHGAETFGEADLKKLQGSLQGQLYEQSRVPVVEDPRLSQHIQAYKPTGKGAEHDRILQYGAQLNDIALQLQEWVSIYQSQGGDGALFSINQPKFAGATRPLQLLSYAAPDREERNKNIAFGRKSSGDRRSGSSRRRARHSRSHSCSRSPSRSKSKSRESKQFIQRIEKLRKNLEVEGQAIQKFYKRNEAEKQQKKSQSEKMTIGQVKAENQMLKKQNREMEKK